jgi:hypothetical protein
VNNDPNARRITMSPSRIRTGTQPLLSLALWMDLLNKQDAATSVVL